MSGFGTCRCDCGRRISPDEDYCSVGCAEAAQREDEEAVMLAVTDADSSGGGGDG